MRWPSAKSKRLHTRFLVIIALTFAFAATTSIVIQPVHCNSIQASPPTASEEKLAPRSEVAPEGKASGAAEPSAAEKRAEPVASQGEASESAAAPKPQHQSEADRKGRASEEATTKQAEAPVAKDTEQKAKDEKQATNSKGAESEKKASSSGKPQQQARQQSAQLAGKNGSSSSSKSKLPANLGTVTSTGSGGPAHYMSKHDAYSAIAEKHGALAQDAMRHSQRVNSDRRSHLQRFGGIQKASGIGDVLSPFKGVTDSGLARTLGASMRSIMKGKYSIPAYVASAVLGAVALMAFYESPISPLPVPALPEPPVGRFPPEMPIISPNTQIPFRTNQQQQQQYGQQAYANQRSFPGAQMPQQQQTPQVLFPAGAAAQQRQMNGGGAVQQLAANFLASVGKQQNAQRKSSLEYDQSSSRSFFGGGNSNQRMSAPANQQKQGNSFLSYLGLGGASGGSSSTTSSLGAPGNGDPQQAPGASGLSSSEPKGQVASVLSNSHVVNKVKSYFSRAAPSSSSSHSQSAVMPATNPYDQYQRMSFMQALAKDTAFLPAFLNPTRKSSPASSGSSPANKLQQSINNVLTAAAGSSSSPSSSANSSPQPIAAASRMQVDSQPQYGAAAQQAPSNKRASSDYGLIRTADRIAHALLDTFSTGILQRHTPAASTNLQQQPQQQTDALRTFSQRTNEESPLMTTASLLSDIMLSSYTNGQQQSASQFVNSLAQASGLSTASSDQQQAASEAKSSAGGEQLAARSDQQQAAPVEHSQEQKQVNLSASRQQATAGSSAAASASAVSASSSHQQDQAAHVRKTRSIGLEYPTYEIAEQQAQGPSKAAQINSFVDLVSDSYKQNKMLFNFVMNRVGLSQALPYVEQILGDGQVGLTNQFVR